MRIRTRTAWVALFLLLLVAVLAYPIGRVFWARSQRRAADLALERRDFAGASTHLANYLAVWPSDPAVRAVTRLV